MQTEKYIYKGDNVYIIHNYNNEYLFYAPTLGFLISLNSAAYRKVKNAFLTNLSNFPELELLLEERFSERLPMDFDITKLKTHYFHLALGLTENCTLKCIYCHADAGENRNMSTELLEASINHAVNETIVRQLKGINASFAVGGEPTYNMSLFKKAISLIREKCNSSNIESYISITTNGFYTQKTAQFVAENVDNILISIDGLQNIQNLHRPTTLGNGSFDLVISTADIVFKYKNSISIRSTVSNQSIYQLKEFIDFLNNRYGKNVDLVLEPLVPLGRGANLENNSVVQAPDLKTFERYFWEAYIYGKSLGIKVSSSSLKRERLASGFCGAMFIPSFTVTTRGIVTTCERDKTGENYGYAKYDNIHQKFIFDDDAIQRNRNIIHLPEKCNDCICLYHCAGDCPDVRSINYDRCDLNRNLLIKELDYEIHRKEVE